MTVPHKKAIFSVAWSPDGSKLASTTAGLNSYNIYIWNPVSGECMSVLEGHLGTAYSVSWNHDASKLASGGVGGSVKVWDVVSSALLHVYEVKQAEVGARSCMEDGGSS